MLTTPAHEAGAESMSAVECKNLGNTFFKSRDFQIAIDWYSKAITKAEPGDKLGVFYNNRGSAQFQIENYGAAIQDATEAITQKFWKGYYRRGCAYAAMGKLAEALKDFKKARKKFPKNKDIKTNIQNCNKTIMEKKFLEAIAAEIKLASTETTPDKFTVPKSYDGPPMPENGPDRDYAIKVMEHFKNQKNLPKKHVSQILLLILEIFKELPNVVDYSVAAGGHITVCGDTHGQYYDLLRIFELNGLPSKENPFLFNGDYVDRGSFSCEVILTMLIWKVVDPSCIHLTRGNHEGIPMNTMYGFKGEVQAKYKGLFDLFTEIFCWLPLAYRLGKQVFVLHGGLFSKDGVTIADIQKVNRVRQISDEGIMCEMLWSDPQNELGRAPSKRGVGTMFGPDVTEEFLKTNNMKMVVRSHEMKGEGYEWQHNKKCLTIFSAPNYIDQMGNKGAYIRFDDTYEPSITTFAAVEHPKVTPMKYANQMMQMQQMFGGMGR